MDAQTDPDHSDSQGFYSTACCQPRPMDLDAERTLNNLHVLAALSPYDKLITNNDAFDIHGPTRLREVYRTWQGERRHQNMTRVRQTVRSAITYVNKSLDDANALLSSSQSQLGETMTLRVDTIIVQHIRMCQGLQKSCAGLTSLLQTYRDDAMLMSQIQLTITEIGDFLRIISPHTERLRRTLTDEGSFTSPGSSPSSPPVGSVGR